MSQKCKFISKTGEACTENDVGGGFCFWHDPHVDKSGMNLTERLESHVRRGGMTRGLKLKRVNLSGINLVNRNSNQGFDLSECDLYRANLQGAHLFNLTLKSGSLMKANLCDANLHCANLENTNLLGTKLVNARLDNVVIGNRLLQETIAIKKYKQNEMESAMDNFEQSEEIYRNLRKRSEDQGLFQLAGRFGYKELIMRRYQLPRWSFSWCFSMLVDSLCGYGEKPENTVLFSLYLILISAMMYFLFGVHHGDTLLQVDTSASLAENATTFLMTLYYSVVTFTTLGYGDITPFGITRFFAAFEAFIGSFTIALFVVVFVKRMTR
ncbi:MAG: ion channel [Aestuariibacter sp.]